MKWWLWLEILGEKHVSLPLPCRRVSTKNFPSTFLLLKKQVHEKEVLCMVAPAASHGKATIEYGEIVTKQILYLVNWTSLTAVSTMAAETKPGSWAIVVSIAYFLQEECKNNKIGMVWQHTMSCKWVASYFQIKKRLLKHKFPGILGVDGNCKSGLAGSALEKLLWMPIWMP